MTLHYKLITLFVSFLIGTISIKSQTISKKMHDEGLNFISKMQPNLQDTQNDAIRNAMAGDIIELEAVRNSRNKATELLDGVTATPIDNIYRLYKPKCKSDTALPLLIYFHGGGWCFGSINSCQNFCATLVKEAQIAVLAVEYPLAPEHPYPAALNSCVNALLYASQHAKELGINPNSISLCGDSAGGNLALTTAVRMIFTQEQLDRMGVKERIPKISSLVLFYPVVKVWHDNSDSWQKYETGYGLDGKIMETFNEAYIGTNDAQIPLISPFNTSTKHLAALPPTLIINADKDILKDQGEDMYNRMKESGVDVKREVFIGTTHLFITVPGQPTAFNRAVQLTKQFLVKD